MEQKKINYREIMNQDRIINISDLLKYILEKIWIVVILAVVCAAGFAGYKYKNDLAAAAAASADTQDIMALEENLTEDEISEVQMMLSLAQNLQRQYDYMSQSVYMQLDATREDRVTITYQLKADTDADTANLAEQYESYINEGGLMTDLAEMGEELDPQYLQELVSATAEDSDLTISIGNGDLDAALADNTVTISVKILHEDKEQCEALADKVDSCIQSYADSAADVTGKFEMVLTNRYYAQVVDDSIWKSVEDYTNRIATERTRLSSLTNGLTASQSALLQAYQSETSTETDSTSDVVASTDETGDSGQTTAVVGISKKYLAIGAAAGIVLGVILLALWYVLKGTVNCVQELQSAYNLRILGEIGGRKGLFAKRPDEKTQIQLLTTTILSACRGMGCEKILLTGSDTNQTWFTELLAELKQSGIEAAVTTSLDSPEGCQKLETYRNVILSERLRKTPHEKVRRERCICLEQQVDILGVVAVW